MAPESVEDIVNLDVESKKHCLFTCCGWSYQRGILKIALRKNKGSGKTMPLDRLDECAVEKKTGYVFSTRVRGWLSCASI